MAIACIGLSKYEKSCQLHQAVEPVKDGIEEKA
jgi:hypothetical protein